MCTKLFRTIGNPLPNTRVIRRRQFSLRVIDYLAKGKRSIGSAVYLRFQVKRPDVVLKNVHIDVEDPRGWTWLVMYWDERDVAVDDENSIGVPNEVTLPKAERELDVVWVAMRHIDDRWTSYDHRYGKHFGEFCQCYHRELVPSKVGCNYEWMMALDEGFGDRACGYRDSENDS